MGKYKVAVDGKTYYIDAGSKAEMLVKVRQIKNVNAQKSAPATKSKPVPAPVPGFLEKLKQPFQFTKNKEQGRFDRDVNASLFPPDRKKIPWGGKEVEYDAGGLRKNARPLREPTKFADNVRNYRPEQNMIIEFPDVGQGSAILIIAPDRLMPDGSIMRGKKMLIDTGSAKNNSGKALDNIRASLAKYGINRNNPLDYLMITHSDEDHAGNGGAIIDDNPGIKLITNGMPLTGTSGEAISAAYKKGFDQRVKVVSPGDSIPLGAISRADILYSLTQLQRASHMYDLNNEFSIGSQIHNGVNSMINPADERGAGLANLIRNSNPADIAVAPHHGAWDPLFPNYIKAAHPQAVIAQMGANNNYGHPDDKVLSTLNKLDVPFYRSDRDGWVTARFNGVNHNIFIGTQNGPRR